MPHYQASYTDQSGRRRRTSVEGPSPKAVHEQLTQVGAVDVHIHAEELFSPTGRNLAAEARVERETPYRIAWRAGRGWLLAIALVLVVAAVQWTHRPPGAPIPEASYLAIALIVYAVLAVSPLFVSASIDRALVWHDWGSVLRLLPFVIYNPLLRQPAMRFFLRSQRATALAGMGRIDEALETFNRFAQISGASAPTLDSMRASLAIKAHRYEDAIVLWRRAAAHDSKFVFDAAIAMLRYGGDVEEARSLLGSRARPPQVELERLFHAYAHGLLALADRQFDDALAHLDRARASIQVELVQTPATRFGFTAVIDGFRALALASSGDAEEASAALAPIEDFLLASGENQLLAACRDAIAAVRRKSSTVPS
ncbi:MAG TPA: tetratricopeptide repeat protein [Labilithrix sp.]|nr:tetratricopeptide repeat protein [Labilithrix sp.]